MHHRLLSLARDSRLALALAVATGVLGGWLIIAQAYLLSTTISRAFLGRESLPQLATPMALLAIVILGRGVLVWGNETAANTIARWVKTELRTRLLQRILELGPAFSRGERTGELTAAAVDGIEALDAYFGQYLPQLIIGTLVPLSILLVVLPVDLLSGVILLVTAPLIPFFMYMIGRGAEASARKQFGSLGRLSSYFLDSLQGLTTLKAFGQSKAQARNIARVSDEFRRLTLKVMQTSFLSAFALELLATISTAIIAVEVGLRLLYSQMQFGQALFLLILAPEFYLPLRLLGQRFHAGLAGTAAARRIFQVLDTAPAGGAPATPLDPSGPLDAPRPGWTIELAGVTFTYPGRDRPALQDVNLRIEPGQHIALVGATGAGKSTLASLLLGFIEPTAGRLSVRSASGEELVGADRRQLMAWVPQRPHLFHDTLAANILIGNPQASEEQVVFATRLARLDTVVSSLPHGLETIIAEGGSRLSGGEAQRVALARAFLRNAPILILDEPTSSLDPENESLLEESTRQLMSSRTVITIAHRLNTVFQADRIIVLREGCIADSGTHAELLALGGEYSRLIDAAAGTWRLPPAVSTASMQQGIPTSARLSVAILPLQGTVEHPEHGPVPVTTGSQSAVAVFRRLLEFLQGSWGWVSLSVLLGSLTVCSSVALMAASAWLISSAALHPSIATLEVAIVGVRLFGITRAVFRYLERLVTHDVTLQVLRNLRVWFYERLEPLAPARLMHYAAGDLLARVVSDVETLENFYVRVLAPPLVAFVVLASVCTYLASQGAVLALPLAGFSLLIGLGLPILVQHVGRGAAADLIRARASLRARLVDILQGLAEIAAFASESMCLSEVNSGDAACSSAQVRLARINGWQSGLSVSLSGLAVWTLLLLTIPLAASGRLAGLMLAPLALITMSAFEALTPLPTAASWWNHVQSAAGRLFDLVEASPDLAEDDLQTLQPSPILSAVHAASGAQHPLPLSVSHLTFTYPGESAPALQEISFEMPADGSLAIVGPSGAGKTSLVNLLMRFWEYELGEIRLFGISLRQRTPEEVRRLLGLVSPNAHFFDTSIYENLRMAGHHVSRSRVEEAARSAQIHDFIAGLPLGYDTPIGENGLQLSAGERQRLSIARVLIKDAPFLVFDEPTANLDPLTENLILQSLFRLMKVRPSLLITHRLVGLENLTEIVVLDRGRLVESGTHSELLSHQGVYRRLWDLQNRIWAAP